MGTVFIVATPIGNLEDLSPRAARILAEADLIAAEDTRRTRTLLEAMGVRGKELVSYHDHNERERADALIERVVREDLRLCVVSDAGTPAIADPGFRLVAAAHAAGVPVQPIPGASALTALVSASGLPSDRVLFVGFLPTKDLALRQEVESWAHVRASVVFFEATRRLPKTLSVIARLLPGSEVAIGRELTKVHEEIVRLPIEQAMEWAESHEAMKGEAVCMIAPKVEAASKTLSEEELVELARAAFRDGASLKDLLVRLRDAGHSRKDLYRILLKAQQEAEE